MTEKLQWHPAFSAALRIELEDEAEYLQIEEEHLLSNKPMQIDILIIKKEDDHAITKNIARIFRKHNIIEYKSPDDYLSINDFYKVYGYACFYQSDTEKVNEIQVDELTITFVCNRYPRKMLRHITEKHGIKVVMREPGIYDLQNNPIRMQLLITKELSKEENYWLQSLRADIGMGEEFQQLVANYEKRRENPYYQAVMDVVARANWQEKKEDDDMLCSALQEILADELNASKEQGEKTGTDKGIQLAGKVMKVVFQTPDVANDELAERFQCSVEDVLKIRKAFEE
jgi:hypothetical protein